jgi:predicted esterase
MAENNNNLTIWQRLGQTLGPNSLLGQDYPQFKLDKKELLRTKSKEEFEKEKEVLYLGLDESIQTLIKLNEENNQNIECIIGFSQGSLLATFLSILITRKEIGDKFPNLKCLIIVSGFIYPLPKNEEIKFYYHNIENLYLSEIVNNMDESLKIQTPSLHVYGLSDPYIASEKSEKLTNLFSNAERHVHDGKHYIPTKKENIDAYVNFLNKYCR